MAQKTSERLKRTALLGFVAVCIGLIGLIWADGLTADAPATPSYNRDTFRMDDSVYLTVTAEAIEYQRSLESGTPAATPDPDEHNGSGQGQGRGQNDQHDAPTATATPTRER
jgi:hypothetical protein